MPKNAVKAFGPFEMDAALLLATYQIMYTPNSVGKTPYPAFMIVINNASNVGVFIEYGDNPLGLQWVRANTDQILNFQTNSQPNGQVACLPKDTVFSIAAPAKGDGFIDITIYYVEQS